METKTGTHFSQGKDERTWAHQYPFDASINSIYTYINCRHCDPTHSYSIHYNSKEEPGALGRRWKDQSLNLLIPIFFLPVPMEKCSPPFPTHFLIHFRFAAWHRSHGLLLFSASSPGQSILTVMPCNELIDTDTLKNDNHKLSWRWRHSIRPGFFASQARLKNCRYKFGSNNKNAWNKWRNGNQIMPHVFKFAVYV